jgi:hypothetical protein
VTYTDAAVDPGWLAALQAEVGTPVSLLGASVEAVDGRPSGHVTLALGDPGLDLAPRLRARGLHAERLDPSDDAQPPAAVADLVAAPPTDDEGEPAAPPADDRTEERA